MKHSKLNLERNLGKGNPLNEKDLAEFIALQKQWTDTRKAPETKNSWVIEMKNIDQTTFDLSAKNPNKKEEAALRQPQQILEEMKALDEESSLLIDNLQLIIDNGR